MVLATLENTHFSWMVLRNELVRVDEPFTPSRKTSPSGFKWCWFRKPHRIHKNLALKLLQKTLLVSIPIDEK